MPDGTPCLCAKCGKTWTPRRGPGRNPKTCSECKEQQRSSRPVGAVATCEHCSKDFVKRATNQKFCALDCYRVAERQKERLRERTRKRQCECSWCGAALNRKHGKKRYFCGRRCQMAYKVCVTDGHSSRSWTPKPQTPPRRVQMARFAFATCRRCSEPFLLDRQQSMPMHGRYCSRQCMRLDGKDRRRARKRDAYVADVWRSRIFERDDYRCQICGKRLEMKQSAPHPKSPTIDHIVPLSAGGTHEPSNCQAAHFLCNAQKSNGTAPGGDQLLLVG